MAVGLTMATGSVFGAEQALAVGPTGTGNNDGLHAPGPSTSQSPQPPEYVYRGVSLWPDMTQGAHPRNPTYHSPPQFPEYNPGKAFTEGMHAQTDMSSFAGMSEEEKGRMRGFNLQQHLAGSDRNKSPFISTTADRNVAVEFATGSGSAPATWGVEKRLGPDGKYQDYAVSRGLIYKVKSSPSNMISAEYVANREGIAEDPKISRMLGQKEWMAYGQIPGEAIQGAEVVERIALIDPRTGEPKPGTWSKATTSDHYMTVDSKAMGNGQRVGFNGIANERFDAHSQGYRIPENMPIPERFRTYLPQNSGLGQQSSQSGMFDAQSTRAGGGWNCSGWNSGPFSQSLPLLACGPEEQKQRGAQQEVQKPVQQEKQGLPQSEPQSGAKPTGQRPPLTTSDQLLGEGLPGGGKPPVSGSGSSRLSGSGLIPYAEQKLNMPMLPPNSDECSETYGTLDSILCGGKPAFEAAGSFAGGAAGGAAAGAACTTFAPGVGTAGCGVAGRAAGSWAGGKAAGWFVEQGRSALRPRDADWSANAVKYAEDTYNNLPPSAKNEEGRQAIIRDVVGRLHFQWESDPNYDAAGQSSRRNVNLEKARQALNEWDAKQQDTSGVSSGESVQQGSGQSSDQSAMPTHTRFGYKSQEEALEDAQTSGQAGYFQFLEKRYGKNNPDLSERSRYLWNLYEQQQSGTSSQQGSFWDSVPLIGTAKRAFSNGEQLGLLDRHLMPKPTPGTFAGSTFAGTSLPTINTQSADPSIEQAGTAPTASGQSGAPKPVVSETLFPEQQPSTTDESRKVVKRSAENVAPQPSATETPFPAQHQSEWGESKPSLPSSPSHQALPGSEQPQVQTAALPKAQAPSVQVPGPQAVPASGNAPAAVPPAEAPAPPAAAPSQQQASPSSPPNPGVAPDPAPPTAPSAQQPAAAAAPAASATTGTDISSGQWFDTTSPGSTDAWSNQQQMEAPAQEPWQQNQQQTAPQQT